MYWKHSGIYKRVTTNSWSHTQNIHTTRRPRCTGNIQVYTNVWLSIPDHIHKIFTQPVDPDVLETFRYIQTCDYQFLITHKIFTQPLDSSTNRYDICHIHPLLPPKIYSSTHLFIHRYIQTPTHPLIDLLIYWLVDRSIHSSTHHVNLHTILESIPPSFWQSVPPFTFPFTSPSIFIDSIGRLLKL